MKSHFNPLNVPRRKKERYLKHFSEDDFRDEIVRPLFLRKGLKDGRDLCGATEEGKDAIFISEDPLEIENIYAIQTKKGNLNMASTYSTNIENAIAQLRTALSVKIPLVKQKKKILPTKVILCASGKINPTARRHILDTINDPRMGFIDADDLIPMVDTLMPELWFGVDMDKYPYLNNLCHSLTTSIVNRPHLLNEPDDPFYCPVTSENFVNIKLNRLRLKIKKESGSLEAVPDLEELSVRQLLVSKYKRIIITGEAGSGKSTALRRMVCVDAENAMKSNNKMIIPILLRAKELKEPAGNLETLLASRTIEILSGKNPAFDLNDLVKGFVHVFIDALDEVPDQASRTSIFNLLNDFSNKYPKIKIYMSSRNYNWLQKLPNISNWIQYRISPIDWRQTTQIVKRLSRSRTISDDEIQEILRRLQDVHGFQLNPLLVSVFVASADYSRRDIPANITEIIKKYTELMLGRWDTSKGFGQQYQAPLKDFLLKSVAGHMHRNRITSVSLSELKMFLERELRERGHETNINSLIEEIVFRSGLFRVLGDEVEFAHIILQEFFAGRSLLEIELQNFILDDWWIRAIVFYFGDNPNDIDKLKDLTFYLDQLDMTERNNGLLTIGLSLQACYLVRISDKINIYVTLIRLLSNDTMPLLLELDATGKHMLLPFLYSYLLNRDAVSCDVQRIEERSIKEQLSTNIEISVADAIEYWQLVGLLECGAIDQFSIRLHSFKPKDKRMLLALHLGAFFYKELRTSEKVKRRKLAKIIHYLDPKIAPFRKQLKNEFKSELLEIRRGEIKALEDSREINSDSPNPKDN